MCRGFVWFIRVATIPTSENRKQSKKKKKRQQQQTTDLHNIEERQRGTWDYEDDSRNVARNDWKKRTQRSLVRTSERSSLFAPCAPHACVTTPSSSSSSATPQKKGEKITNKQTPAARSQSPKKNGKHKNEISHIQKDCVFFKKGIS